MSFPVEQIGPSGPRWKRQFPTTAEHCHEGGNAPDDRERDPWQKNELQRVVEWSVARRIRHMLFDVQLVLLSGVADLSIRSARARLGI